MAHGPDGPCVCFRGNPGDKTSSDLPSGSDQEAALRANERASAGTSAMAFSMFGTKVGMTRVFDADGAIIPVSVIQLGPCVVTQVRTEENDGYAAVQIGFGEMKARNSTMPMIGHDAK